MTSLKQRWNKDSDLKWLKAEANGTMGLLNEEGYSRTAFLLTGYEDEAKLRSVQGTHIYVKGHEFRTVNDEAKLTADVGHDLATLWKVQKIR